MFLKKWSNNFYTIRENKLQKMQDINIEANPNKSIYNQCVGDRTEKM